MDLLREFHGPNAGYAIALYEQYLEDPDSVDAENPRVVLQARARPRR